MSAKAKAEAIAVVVDSERAPGGGSAGGALVAQGAAVETVGAILGLVGGLVQLAIAIANVISRRSKGEQHPPDKAPQTRTGRWLALPGFAVALLLVGGISFTAGGAVLGTEALREGGPPCLGAPGGNVEFGPRADSPRGDLYAREVEPPDAGQLGIFDNRADRQIRVVDLQESNNPLKGLCWSPDGRLLAVMYHHDPAVSGKRSYVAIVDPAQGVELKRISVAGCPHSLRFTRKEKIMVGNRSPC